MHAAISKNSEETKKDKRRPAPIAKSINRLKDVLGNQEPRIKNRIDQYKASIGKIVKIPLEDIYLDENVRNDIDTESSSFKSLLSSIKKHGIQQNIVVDFRVIDDQYKIVCISGHRRVLAARQAGNIGTISALIKQFDDEQTRIELGLIENILREDLYCLDIAKGYKDLANHGWSREKLAKAFGKTDRTIHSYLKMAEWPDKAKEIILSNKDLFTAKLLTRKVACRKFSTEQELLNSLKALLSVKTSPVNKISPKMKLKEKIDAYLSDKDYSPKTIDAILATFKDLKLI